MEFSIAVILCCGIFSFAFQFGSSLTLDEDNVFFETIKTGSVDRVKEYLSAHPDTDLNAGDTYGNTGLIIAAANGNESIAKFLIERGADVNKADEKGNTPLFVAALNSNDKIFETFINNGADVHHLDGLNVTALSWAAINGNGKPAEELIKKGVHWRSDMATPLHSAATNSNEKLVELMIKAGADVNAECDGGLTPIFFAVLNDPDSLERELPEALRREHHFSERFLFETMLMHRTNPIREHAAEKIIEILIQNGADINHKNKSGDTPYQLAMKLSNERLKEFLKEHGAKVQNE